ncbi:MAG: glyceraldehyde dehydrogenase subunit alpha [Thermoprotei archaeon]
MSTTSVVVEERRVTRAQTVEGGLFGKPLKRVEDLKLVRGLGGFIGDIRVEGMVYAAFVRSPYAHAKIVGIDPTEALRIDGVIGVLSAEDLKHLGSLPTVEEGEERRATPRRPLAEGVARYVGEAVAAVVAKDPYTAEDAAELVRVEYQPLEAVVDAEDALKPNSPLVHPQLNTNVCYHSVNTVGDLDEAFAKADHIVSLKLLNQRLAPSPLETRGVLASYDRGSGELTVWATTQDPHGLRDTLASILGLPQAGVRVIAPDMGGAFGSKISIYPEDVVVSYASMHFNRPVKWVETRRENIVTTTHGRGQVQYVEAAVRSDGKIIGLKVKIISDSGAYNTPGALDNPSLTAQMFTGVYDIRAARIEVYSVLTNKVPQDAYRGAGRPEAAYLIERTMDVVARRLGVDVVDIRRINYIAKDMFPYTTVGGLTYDLADYEANLDRALEFSAYTRLRREQGEARRQGRLVGVGVATWTEICGFGPTLPQTAAITVTPGGEVLVSIGGHPHGQGHHTPIAQVVADELGVDIVKVKVRHGDTSLLPWSTLTAGSRSAALTGSAALLSARKIKRKMSLIASKLLGSDSDDLVFSGGYVYTRSDPSKKLRFEDVADAAYKPWKLPEGVEPTLFEYTAYTPPDYLFPYGTHIAMVEVDRETGEVTVLKYFAVDDVGRVINPMLVEGQVHGGIMQGAGQALLEEVVYDGSGQPITQSFAEYLIPSIHTIPNIEWTRTETPTARNPLGVKGVGEAGTIAATPTIVNAVEDALSEYNVVVDRMPLRPDYIRSLINKSGR